MTPEYENDDYRPDKETIRALIERKLSELGLTLHSPPSPLNAPKRGNICQNFWGRNWCRHLENFSHWEHRLNRGRTLLRKGSVYGATIEQGQIHAYVAGDDLYEVTIKIDPVSPEFVQELSTAAETSALSLLDLWEGRLSDTLLEQLTSGEHSLFPQPGELKSICHCMDWADLCEHGAAVLYGAGILFEQSPSLLFLLRGINPEDLIKSAPATDRDHAIPQNDWEDIFRIEIPEN